MKFKISPHCKTQWIIETEHSTRKNISTHNGQQKLITSSKNNKKKEGTRLEREMSKRHEQAIHRRKNTNGQWALKSAPSICDQRSSDNIYHFCLLNWKYLNKFKRNGKGPQLANIQINRRVYRLPMKVKIVSIFQSSLW